MIKTNRIATDYHMNSSQLLPLEIQLFQELKQTNATNHLAVAFSGGMDSKVLLYALVRLREAGLVNNIMAIHVNHGLQAEAELWEKQCKADCLAYQVPFIATQLQLSDSCPSNIESAARDGRYQFFESTLRAEQCLLMAHHQNDQAETLLFRLLRGCGIQGAAAMPSQRPLGKGRLLRPLLMSPRVELADYAKAQKLQWIEDPSNHQEVFSRNFLRHQVLTKIQQKWPEYVKTLSRFAKIAAEQSLLLDEIASQDLLQASTTDFVDNDTIAIQGLLSLSHARKKNLLHYWGKVVSGRAPTSGEIGELLKQLPAAQKQSIQLSFAGMTLRSYQGQLFLCAKMQPQALVAKVSWENMLQAIDLSNNITIVPRQSMSGKGLRLPEEQEKVWVASRIGGERCLPDYRDKSTQLKKIYQELRVPPWQREWLPIIYYNQEVVAVPGVFVAKDFVAESGEVSLTLSIKGC